jgi:hypothetical protein
MTERQVGPEGWLPPVPPGPPPRDPNTIAFTGGVLSIAGASVLYISNGFGAPLSLALGIAGTVCAKIARDRIRRGETDQNSMWADVALAVGGLCVALSVIACIVVALVLIID